MKVACPKCNASLKDRQGGGTLTKCRKCGYDGSMGEDMSWMKNEWEIQTKQGELMGFWEKNE